MKKFLALSMGIITFISCNKDNKSDEPVIPEAGKTFPIKMVITRGKERTELIFENKNGKIAKVTRKSYENYIENPTEFEHTENVITYEGNYPKKNVITNKKSSTIEREEEYTFTNGKLTFEKNIGYDKYEEDEEVTYTYDGDKLKKRVDIFKRGNTTYYSEREFEYISPTEIKVTETTYDKDNSPSSTISSKNLKYYTYTLDNEGRVLEEKKESRFDTYIEKYTYDDKKNINSDKFSKLTDPEYFIKFYSSKNNILKVTRKHSTKDDNGTIKWSEEEVIERNEYIYNKDGYPIQRKSFDGKDKLIEITDYTFN